ncbi:MAG: M56 family metallopeptidase [Oscillospiraceae bacterium]|nr:M56 family metallopeptidase [Oscillospiraceae bacterium]
MREVFTLVLISSLFTGFIMLLLCTYDLHLGKNLSPKKRTTAADLTLALQPAMLLLAIMFSMVPTHEVATGISTSTVIDGFTVPVTVAEVSTAVDNTVGVTVSYGIDFGIVFGIFTLTWLVGVAETALYKIVSYLRFVHNLKKSLAKCDYDAPVTVFTSPKATSPFLMGFFRAKIILPDKPMDEAELELAIKHELIHHKRHDIQKKFWMELLKCVNWFNPAFYVFAKKLSELSELTVDEILSSDLDHTQRKAYGGLLLKFALAGTGSVFCSELSHAASNLAARLEVIMNENRSKTTRKEKIALATLAVVVVAVVGLSIGICAAAMPEETKDIAASYMTIVPNEEIELVKAEPVTRTIEIDESKTIETYGIEQDPVKGFSKLSDVGEKIDEETIESDYTNAPTKYVYLLSLTNSKDGSLEINKIAYSNGEIIVISGTDGNAISLSPGDEVNLTIMPDYSPAYSNTDGKGEHVEVGYVLDEKLVEVYHGYIPEDGLEVPFTTEKDGEYQLYLINYCAGMQNYESVTVEIK